MTSLRPRLCLSLALLLLLATIGFSQPVPLAATQAIVTFLYGDVQVRHGTGGYTPARVNEVLRPGDGLKTGSNARAQLSLGDDRYVRLDQKSQLLLTQVQTDGLTSLKALAGNIWVTIERKLGAQSKFEVVTPSVVAAVRGTVFSCEVEDSGASQVNCYEGEVAVSGDQEQLTVRPEQCCRFRKGARGMLAALDMDRQEASDFVRYNRQRDALQHLGNPLVLVSLAERGRTRPEAAAVTSNVLADLLSRQGFIARNVSSAEVRQARFDADGWLRPAAQADYVVVGAIAVTLSAAGPRLPQVATARVRAHLVSGGDYHPLLVVDATATGTGTQRPVAVRSALLKLGEELAGRLSGGIVQEMCADRPAGVRVDLLKASAPHQLAPVRDLLRGLPGVERVTPLPRPGSGSPAVLVTGTVTPQQVADYLRQKAGAWMETPEVAGRVVRLRLTGTPPAPGQ